MTSVPYAENDNPAAAASPTVASSADSVPGPDEPDLGNSVQVGKRLFCDNDIEGGVVHSKSNRS